MPKMPAQYLRTSQIAQAMGVHPNTVRLYEEWGFLPPIPRTASGYRCFTPAHLEQMRLARIALQWPYPGGKQVVLDLIHQARDNHLAEALVLAYQYLDQVHAEQAYAEAAVAFLERWAQGQAAEPAGEPLLIGTAAARLGVSSDVLRNWERNGLLAVPRHPQSGYRLYGAAALGRARVIRVLRQAGYSMTAVLRMCRQFDAGQRNGLRDVLDTVDPDEDIYYVTDNWLTTLREAEARAQAIIEHLRHMQATAVSPKDAEKI